jgi:hypothetical protein
MSLQGNLKTMSVPDLLQFLAAGRKSGTLKIGRGPIVKQIYLKDGLIVGSNSNDPKELIGQALLHYGKISEDQLQVAMQAHRQSGERLGRALTERGFVTEEAITEVLRTRTLEIIYDLFIWEEAEFEFIENDPFPDDMIRIQVDATSVIMDGIYRIDEWGRYRQVIKSDRTFFELDTNWTHFLNEGKEIRDVIYHVEKRLTAAEICYNLHTTPFHASALLFDLIEKGAIRVAGEAAEPAPEVAPPPVTQSVPELLDQARAEIDEENYESALALIVSALDQEPQNSEAGVLRDEAERKYMDHVFKNGLSPLSVIAISVSLDELEHQGLGPQEGFVLSRINGELNVDSILSVCPFREADTLRMIKKLLDTGVVSVTTRP